MPVAFAAALLIVLASVAAAVDSDEAIEKARALESAGSADEAFVYLSELAEQDHKLAEDASVLLELSRLTPSTDESVQLLERALERARDGAQTSVAKEMLGDYLYARGSYLAAAAQYASAAEKAPGPAQGPVLLKRCASLLAAGDADAAAEAYGQLAERGGDSDPTRPWAQLGLGHALVVKGDLEEAVLVFEGLATEYATHEVRPRALAGAGEALAAAGHTARARENLDALVREYPGSYEAILARDDLASLPPDTTGTGAQDAPLPETAAGSDDGR